MFPLGFPVARHWPCTPKYGCMAPSWATAHLPKKDCFLQAQKQHLTPPSPSWPCSPGSANWNWGQFCSRRSDQEIWNCWWEGGGQERVQEVMAKAQTKRLQEKGGRRECSIWRGPGRPRKGQKWKVDAICWHQEGWGLRSFMVKWLEELPKIMWKKWILTSSLWW